MSQGPTVRLLAPEDRATVRTLHREAFDPQMAFDDIVLDRLFLHEQAINLVAELDDAIVGYASAIHGHHDPARLYTIHVDKEARRQSVATHLLDELERRLSARRCTRIQLYVHAENEAAVKLYQERGYEITAEDEHRYPTMTPSTGYTMEKQL